MSSTIHIKPLSVNAAWQGRRYKTDTYKGYERAMLLLLPRRKIPEGKLKLIVDVGLSSKAADVDNILKPFVDILQKKYKFNDKHIYKILIEKTDVKKGYEYITWDLVSLENDLNLTEAK